MPTYDKADQVIVGQGDQTEKYEAGYGTSSYAPGKVAGSGDSGGGTGDGGVTIDAERIALLEEAGISFDTNIDTGVDNFTKQFGDEFYWQDAVVGVIEQDIKHLADITGQDLSFLSGWFNGHKFDMLKFIENGYVKGLQAAAGPFGGVDFTKDPSFVQAVITAGRAWMGQYVPGYRDLINTPAGGGGGGGGGGGRSIRGQFDLDQMAREINDLSRVLVLAGEPNARAIAKAFVDMVVASPGQNHDFETFVRSKLLGSDRAKMIYENKPDSMSHEQFLQPFVQLYQQMVGAGYGEDQANTAIAGARLNASPQAYSQRLTRTSQVQSSAPFLGKLAGRMQGFRRVLKN